jgi:stage V sporulation protein AD
MQIKKKDGELIEKDFYYMISDEIDDVSVFFPKYEKAFRHFKCIKDGMIGKITDGLTKDGSDMGAAMSRAAADTVYTYLSLNNSPPENFDAIFSGDLGKRGSEIFKELIRKDFPHAAEIHEDCGTLLYDMNKKNVNSGASGCGCSASVLSTYILPKLKSGELKNILFFSTGALMSPSSVLQGENILGIAPIINIKRELQ